MIPLGIATVVLLVGGIFFLIHSTKVRGFDKAFIATVVGYLLCLASVLTGTILVTSALLNYA